MLKSRHSTQRPAASAAKQTKPETEPLSALELAAGA